MTPDAKRNFGSWLTERLKVKVEWSRSIFDLRLGVKKSGLWKIIFVQFWQPVKQNFWNGIFTTQLYVIKTKLFGFVPILIPRVGVVIRFSHDRWFEAGIGYLFDRGEFGAKFAFMEWNVEEKFNPGCNAVGFEEGPV